MQNKCCTWHIDIKMISQIKIKGISFHLISNWCQYDVILISIWYVKEYQKDFPFGISFFYISMTSHDWCTHWVLLFARNARALVVRHPAPQSLLSHRQSLFNTGLCCSLPLRSRLVVRMFKVFIRSMYECVNVDLWLSVDSLRFLSTVLTCYNE